MEQTTNPSYMQIVNCGYCAKSMRRKNLKDHTTRCHKGLSPIFAEGEALQKLLDELRIQREKEIEKKELERLTIANKKREEKQRLKILEKEQEIIQQRELEARRKEQEEVRKKNKREFVRLEKKRSKSNKAPEPSSSSRSSVLSTKNQSTYHSNSQPKVSNSTQAPSVENVKETSGADEDDTAVGATQNGIEDATKATSIIHGNHGDSRIASQSIGSNLNGLAQIAHSSGRSKLWPYSSHDNAAVQSTTGLSYDTNRAAVAVDVSGGSHNVVLAATKNTVTTHQNQGGITNLTSFSIGLNSNNITLGSASSFEKAKVVHCGTPDIEQGLADSSTSNYVREHSYSAQDKDLSRAKTSPIAEMEMRSRFKESRCMEDILKCCPNFVYDASIGSVKCIQCCSSASSRPIAYKVEPDDSKPLQLAKLRDVKKKMLDHLYKTSMHKKHAQWSSSQPEFNKNVDTGTRVIRAIYGKIKTGGGYKGIEQTISERAADDLDVGNINHGRHFASSMTQPLYEAVKRRVQKSIKRVMPGFDRPPPFCLLADKMTPYRTTLQIVGIISPSQETGKLQPICLGVKECHDGTGLGTSEEMIDCLKEYYSTQEIKDSLVGVAVDGAYHHHNIKEHLPALLKLPEQQKEILATCWDAAHLIELSAQKSRGQNSKEKAILTPWIRDTFDTVTSIKTFAGRGKHWKELQENSSLAAAKILNQDVVRENISNKPLKKFQSFSNTRFARFSQRVLGNMRENFKATCGYIESKAKDGSGLLNRLNRPEFPLRLCGLEDIYDEIGRASEKLQSSRIYGWNTVEILEQTQNTLRDMSDCLRQSKPHPRMKQFNPAVEEVSESCSYQGVSLQRPSSEMNIQLVISKVREDLSQHVENFNMDLYRRSQEQTPKICHLSREAFALERLSNRPENFVPSEFDQIVDLHSAAGLLRETLSTEEWHREYARFSNTVRAEKSRLEGYERGNKGQIQCGTEEAIYSKIFIDGNFTHEFKNVAYLLCRSALQSSCEAVTEGMGSVVKNTLEGRENMAIEKLSQEVFIRLNGPKSNKNCNGILREAGDLRFGGRTKWHFITSPKAKYNASSKVLSRLNSEVEKFNFLSDSDDE